MNSFQPEPHVAQQSRREKLRICPSLYDPPSHPAMFLSPPGLLDFASPGGEGINFLTNSSSGIHEGTGWIQNSIGGGALIQTPLFPSHLYSLKQPGLSSYQDLHFPSSQLYQNAFQDVVTSSSTTPCSWVDNTNELLLLNRQSQQWYGEGDYARMKGEGGLAVVPASGSSTQSLSLSLSSNPLPELQVAQFEDRFGQEDVMQASRASNNATSSLPYSKFLTSSVPGVVDLSAVPDPRHGLGPLGPFTGYAAVLKSSKFLKPAQQLLDQFCNMGMGLRAGSSNRYVSAIENGSNGRRGHSGFSSSSLYGSTKHGGDGCVNPRPEVQQKKAKLLFMQEEVCKRYKQYHQQMQMVVSSFESVPGLSAATPYTSLVLKSVLKHFRCLKNAITDQLRHVSNLVSEEFMPLPGPSKGEASPRLKYIAQSFRKEKAMSQNSLNFFDHCQPVWRPQRGLPERAVSVLRAWLFDHFLHPYPTDTDKHMLATQTGLSRNQVSNWFINARVRLWKPMVEEIHNLETKEMSGMDLNSSNRNGGKPGSDDRGRPSDQILESQSNKVMDPMLDDESQRAMEQWHRGKRSRVEECGAPAGMDRSLMSLAAYPVGMDIGSLGPVSLTLGLRHNNEGQHFGGHMVHDFVG